MSLFHDEDFEECLRTRDFDRFARRTMRGWRALAQKCLRELSAPPSLGEEDLVQVMLLEAQRHFERYDPERGPTVRTHVVWRATDRARKKIHSERRDGHARRGAKFDLPFSTLHETHGEERWHALLEPSRPGQEHALTRSRAVEALGALRPAFEALYLTDSFEQAAFVALQSQKAREALGAKTLEEASERFRLVVERLAEEVAT